ncbi:hypothetical protein F5Y03DRAFT_409410 [Xylaria venustula]|nr:hypothetical protein F5Y03DRAFT_409410 [Xylaria venustula]
MQISTYLFAAIAAFAAQGTAQSCIRNGNICTLSSNPPCCSGFCFIDQGAPYGLCH